MPDLRQTEHLFITLSGDGAADLICLGARVRERLSTISEMRMEFFSKDTSFDPKTILGKRITLETAQGFKFSSIVVSVEDIGLKRGDDVYAAELRPWLWLTTIGDENRIFQNMSTPQVIEAVFQKLGFSDYKIQVNAADYKPRDYCVQYGESNFAFLSRLMEEDGIFYHFEHSGPVEQLMLADGSTTPKDEGEIAFTSANIVAGVRADLDTIYEWSVNGKVVSGKVTLWDYDFLRPSSNLVVSAANKSGSTSNNQERYQSVGHYKTADVGENLYARTLARAHDAEAERATGLCNIAKLRTGVKFKLTYPDRSRVEGDYKVVGATHFIRFDDGPGGTELQRVTRAAERIEFPEQMALFETEFEVMPGSVTFAPQRTTPWPEVPSLLTALVTGPSGDEIHTDDYGRIRVQFPWDRDGKKDDKSSCWVRTVMPWAGKDYGFIAVPRIGMEVIIQFERGNIDRPICTGMVYNGVNKPPYGLPGEMDTIALRTNSTKGGGGYHELSFKDKKDAEKIFFQSEKDYEQKIKNNAVITIGMEKMDKGDLTQTVYRHMTETIKTGDVTQTVETGSRITTIKTDDTTTTTGKSTTTITGDTALTVKDGNLTEKIDMGNMSTSVAMGNIAVKADLGKIEIEAMQSITLKVGGSSIKIDQIGVTITGAVTVDVAAVSISVKADAMATVKAALTTVKADGMLTLNGSITLIN